MLSSFCCLWRLVADLVLSAPGGCLLPLAAGCCPWRPNCCPSFGCSLAARLLPLVLLSLVAGSCPRSAAPGGWLLPSFCSPWRLAAALFLLPLAAGCCPRSAAPGCWLLPSFCPWRLASVVLLPMVARCCSRSTAPGGWLLPSFFCTWRLVAALVLLPLAAGCCTWRLAAALADGCCPWRPGCCPSFGHFLH